MREIRDRARLEEYLARYGIPKLFDTEGLPFRLYEYAPGEMVNILRPPEESVKFVVSGRLDLYSVREDGERYLLKSVCPLTFLGDLEFCGRRMGENYQEVVKTVHTVELPLRELRETLLRDNRFLRFLLEELAGKLAQSSPPKAVFPSLEAALLACLREECPGGEFAGVEAMAFRLHCSRRQLQRVLRSLTDRGLLEKCGRGCYCLTPAGRKRGAVPGR